MPNRIKTNKDFTEGYYKGRADKYQEIISEYMLLTEKQVAEIRADAIDEFARAFIEEGKKIKYLRHLWIESTCKKIAEQLKEQK